MNTDKPVLHWLTLAFPSDDRPEGATCYDCHRQLRPGERVHFVVSGQTEKEGRTELTFDFTHFSCPDPWAVR